jgi:hypothetical protein
MDRAMERAAGRDAHAAAIAANPRKPKRPGEGNNAPRPSADELVAFYAGLVNADGFLPASTISNTMRDAMLARGSVTAERLRMRGVR